MKATDLADVRARRGDHVLAFRDHAVQPWVVWFVDKQGHCHHGFYTADEQKAWANLAERAGEQ
jgi:hypothetical protein